jgi:MtN3 and saliva related transmembrane protein
MTNLIGILAGVLTTVSFLPQVIRAARTKSTGDISLGMYVILAVGIFLWFIYGISIGSLPVILANGVTFVLAIIILALKVKYR